LIDAALPLEDDLYWIAGLRERRQAATAFLVAQTRRLRGLRSDTDHAAVEWV
jgi:hypothetical protein